MKSVFVTVLASALAAVVAYFAYMFDGWLGLVAYTYGYAAFSIAIGILAGAIASGVVGHHGVWTGLFSFACVASLLFLPPPSERILRSVLLRAEPGTAVSELEAMIEAAYADSGYVAPRVQFEDGRAWVGLYEQEPGNATAIFFGIEDGVIVSGHFSAD